MFYIKYKEYNDASDKIRMDKLIDLLVFTYTKTGFPLTKTIIAQEMNGSFAQGVLLGLIIKKSIKSLS